MLIQKSVGSSQSNLKPDVCMVQASLNENIDRVPGAIRLVVDGVFGDKTSAEIMRFQKKIAGSATGVVEPESETLGQMAEGFSGEFNVSSLKGVMPAANRLKIDLYYPHLVAGMAAREIDTPLRQAHFIAQLAHESGSFVFAEELATGEAYEGRADLGNTQPGDGRRFKGRGLIQLTGCANYRDYGRSIGVDMEDGVSHLTVATDPQRAVDVACWFWAKKKLNKHADADDVKKVTRRINGGTNGLADRKHFLERARFFLRC
jgi:putative chitinase